MTKTVFNVADSTASFKQLSLDELEERVKNGLVQVEDLLGRSLSDSRGVINQLIGHLAKAGGKRMRPALVLLTAHLGPLGINSKVIQSAVVVELTHLATLYHDDVIDSAPTRRGVEAAHKVWGNSRAVLAGDLVFARASQLSAGLGEQAIVQHAQTFDRLCTGELNESFGPATDDDPIAFYLQVLADKTGSLVAQSARFGADMSGADPAVAVQVAEFGERVGVAFQLADDVIDLASPEEVSGKRPGTDLREGVVTMPVLLLRQAAAQGKLSTAEANLLADVETVLRTGVEGPDAAARLEESLVERTVAALAAHPVLEQTRQLAFQWCEDAKKAIAGLDQVNPAVHEALEAFADSLVARIS